MNNSSKKQDNKSTTPFPFLDKIFEYLYLDTEPETYLEPDDEIQENEKVIGEMSPSLQKLHTIRTLATEKINRHIAELQLSHKKMKDLVKKSDDDSKFEFFREREVMKEKLGKMHLLSAEREAIDKIFWAALHTEFPETNSIEVSDDVGIRKGWKVVTW